MTRAYELSHTRIVAGMRSPVDVIGGRVLATALTAAALNDPANAALKAAARAQAAQYLRARTGTTADTLFDFAHTAAPGTDPYASREANARAVAPRPAYTLRPSGPDRPLVVPKGAEVLLETRLPYLNAEQRRAVLRSTALRAGYPVLDGAVLAHLDAALGGFHAHDTWRNDINGRGGLVKSGTGTLALTGANSFTGRTAVQAGTLVAGSADALGRGPVTVRGGALRVDVPGTARIRADCTQIGKWSESRAPWAFRKSALRLAYPVALSVRKRLPR
nr:autotransporter-associated beta strand repeat-containing protein [Parafrankia discariae]